MSHSPLWILRYITNNYCSQILSLNSIEYECFSCFTTFITPKFFSQVRCPQIGHLGILKRHDALYNSLTGRDLDLDFNDTLAVESESNIPTHALLEKLHDQPLFRKK